MLAIYPQEVILIAARECGHTGKDISDVLKLLQSWKEKGLESLRDVENYVQSFHDQTSMIRELHRIWGTDEKRIGKADRSLVSKWEHEYGFSREMILYTAKLAAEAKLPMAYLDRILTDYKNNGIFTPEQAEREHEKAKAGGKKKNDRLLPAQDFEQRSYDDVPDEMMGELAQDMKAYKQKNGGKSDA